MNLYDETLQAAVKLYGEAEENLPLLCSVAVDSYTARLREGVTAEDCAEVLSTAAALVAVATLRCGGTISDFSAAAVSVRFTDGAEGFIAAAERMMAPYLAPSGFAFRSVRG